MGTEVGEAEVGAWVGTSVTPVGYAVVGEPVGEEVGEAVGETVGALVGEPEVGVIVGPLVPPVVVGDAVGEVVGEAVGERVVGAAVFLHVIGPSSLVVGAIVGGAGGMRAFSVIVALLRVTVVFAKKRPLREANAPKVPVVPVKMMPSMCEFVFKVVVVVACHMMFFASAPFCKIILTPALRAMVPLI